MGLRKGVPPPPAKEDSPQGVWTNRGGTQDPPIQISSQIFLFGASSQNFWPFWQESNSWLVWGGQNFRPGAFAAGQSSVIPTTPL